MNSNELLNPRLISGIAIGEEGTYFSLNWVDNKEYRSSIYVQDLQGVRRVTFGGHENRPMFRDGFLYYISSTNDEDRVMQLGGLAEPIQICSFRKIITYAPYEGGVLVVASENFKSTRPFVINRLKYKHDSTGLLRKRRALYFARGEKIKLTGGNMDVADVKTNGKKIIISATHVNDDYSLTDLYEVNFISGAPTRITKGRGSIDAFDINSDGEIAYIGHRSGVRDWATRDLFIAGREIRIKVGNTAGIFTSTDMYDDAAPDVIWDSGKVYTVGQEGGATYLYVYDGTELKKTLSTEYSVRHFDVLNGKVAVSYSRTDTPSILSVEGEDFDPNEGMRGRASESLTVNGIEGWVIRSSSSDPVLLFIHGGPHGAFGTIYNMEMQYFSRAGYNIAYCNPGGSMGYGEEFAAASVGNWGGRDSEEIMGFIEGVCTTFGFHGKRGVKGISYGGYMVNWLVTQSRQFDAAISEKGISNLLSSCGTSDIGYWFDAPEEIGRTDPWSQDSISLFMDRSPISYVRNVKTPVLLIHGEDDHRCPIEQSEQFFTALKFYGVESTFIRVPGESHELDNRENPKNRSDLITIKREWFDRYLKGVGKEFAWKDSSDK